ncbi:MAG: tetraacyldisaccharide 4'-kinase [Gammaproteobacteria bacterium]
MKGWRERLTAYLQARWYSPSPPWYLLPPAWLFGAVAALRRALYAHGILRSVRVAARVVIVGNITVGGSGKTPLVAWLARNLVAEGIAVGIVTRGYRGENHVPHLLDANATDEGDEARWLARAAGVPVAVGCDRAAAAQLLFETAHPDLILSDDGLQHYRLGRDVEIIAVDGARGFGNGALLPAGPLREPTERIRFANAVVLKGEGCPPLPSNIPVLRMRYSLVDAIPLAGGATVKLTDFRGRPIAALAGIADPESFFRALEAAGLMLERHLLPDHAGRDSLAATLVALGGERPILMTDKDAAKLPAPPANAFRVPLALALTGADAARLLALVRGAPFDHVQEES